MHLFLVPKNYNTCTRKRLRPTRRMYYVYRLYHVLVSPTSCTAVTTPAMSQYYFLADPPRSCRSGGVPCPTLFLCLPIGLSTKCSWLLHINSSILDPSSHTSLLFLKRHADSVPKEQRKGEGVTAEWKKGDGRMDDMAIHRIGAKFSITKDKGLKRKHGKSETS